jgi:hypothetical protein
MKAFLYRVLAFSSPVIVGAIALELFIRISPNAFNAKAHFIENRAPEVKLVTFGSSHNQNAVNPEFMPFLAANLAYGGQDIKLDSALLFHYAPQLTALKAVVLELDYHSLEELNDPNYFRLAWYNQMHNIEYGHVPLLSKISLYASEPEFFNDHIKRTFDPREYKYEMNEFGFLRNDFPGVFLSNNNDSVAIADSAPKRLANRHTTLSVENYKSNVACLKSMIDFCKQKNVKVILVSSPMYSTYRAQENEEKLNRRMAFLNEVIDNQWVYFLDFEANQNFKLTDFKNDDHLNSLGAEKYTKMLSDSLLKLVPSLQ